MSRLIAAITNTDPEQLVEQASACLAQGADMVELRLDAVGDVAFATQLADRVLPCGRWIATLRSVEEGGQNRDGGQSRLAQLRKASELGAGAVDVEWGDMGHLGGNGGLLPATKRAKSGSQSEWIVSAHDFDGIPASLPGKVRSLARGMRGAVVKVAWRCLDIRENITALEILRADPGRRIAICMGEKGIMSRVLARKFGAWGTFCAADDSAGTAPGQVKLGEMLGLYGWQRQDSETEVYGVIGSPVCQSMSPTLFNDQFRASGMNAVYLPLRADSSEELAGFLSQCQTLSWLGVRGFSVTAPHKQAVLRWAGDGADSLARRIGAANTLRFDGSKVEAFNTDYLGAMSAVESGMGLSAAEMRGMGVAVLGAGGVARAVVAGLCERGCAVTIYNRSARRGEVLASEFGARCAPWEARQGLDARLVVNCTTVGMVPEDDASPLGGGVFRAGMVVFDTVYHPMRTLLLRQAEAAGCVTIDGVTMFVEQAAAQYHIWTDRRADVSRMREVVVSRLTE